MKEPLVTIIMPVYNTAPYVGEAITSILGQRYENWELIVVNDGSTDTSEAIIKTFTDRRIYYYKQDNQGVAVARNVGLQKMKGRFFCFLDSDDVLPPESISLRISVLLDNPTITFVDGVVEIFEDKTLKTLRRWTPSFKGFPQKKLMQLSEQCFTSLSWMIRVIPTIKYEFPSDMQHGEDLSFLIQIGDTGIYDYVPNTIYKYRVRGNSAMTNLDGLGRGYEQLYKKIRKDFGDQQSLLQHLYLFYRIRRIMVLTYLSQRKWTKAFKYLVAGTID